MLKIFAIGATLLIVGLFLVSCAGKRPPSLAASNVSLAPCPSSPKCVSSDARDRSHQVAPLWLDAPPGEAWKVARGLVSELPRTRIVKELPGYLHAECRSKLFGFVDDLELQLRRDAGLIAVRSSARWGYSDFGVNRRRVEKLRAALISRKMIR